MSTSSNAPVDTTDLTVARRILDRARPTHAKLKPAVDLVDRALAGAGGQPMADPAEPFALKAAKTVELLQATFEEDPALAERIAAVVAEFKATTATMNAADAAQSAQTLSDEQLQALKRSALFLSKFPEAMKSDALLAQLFPLPAVLQADSE